MTAAASVVSIRLPFCIRITNSRNAPFSSKIASYPSLFFTAIPFTRSGRLVFPHITTYRSRAARGTGQKTGSSPSFLFLSSVMLLLFWYLFRLFHSRSRAFGVSCHRDLFGAEHMPSQIKRRFARRSPVPRRYRITSFAWMVPITPGVRRSPGRLFGRRTGKNTAQAPSLSRDNRCCLPVKSANSTVKEGESSFPAQCRSRDTGSGSCPWHRQCHRPRRQPGGVGLIDGIDDITRISGLRAVSFSSAEPPSFCRYRPGRAGSGG